MVFSADQNLFYSIYYFATTAQNINSAILHLNAGANDSFGQWKPR